MLTFRLDDPKRHVTFEDDTKKSTNWSHIDHNPSTFHENERFC